MKLESLTLFLQRCRSWWTIFRFKGVCWQLAIRHQQRCANLGLHKAISLSEFTITITINHNLVIRFTPRCFSRSSVPMGSGAQSYLPSVSLFSSAKFLQFSGDTPTLTKARGGHPHHDRKAPRKKLKAAGKEQLCTFFFPQIFYRADPM